MRIISRSISGRIRDCVCKLRCLSRPMEDKDAQIMGEVLEELQGCALHLEDEGSCSCQKMGTIINSRQIADELAATMER